MHVDSADRERQFWIRNAGVTCSSHVGSTITINNLRDRSSRRRSVL